MLPSGYRRALALVVVLVTASAAAAQTPPPRAPVVTPPPPAPPAPAARPAAPQAPVPPPPPAAPTAPAPAESFSDEDIDRQLQSMPLFDTLREVDPEGYAMARKILKEAVETKPAPGVVMKQAQAVFASRTRRYILGGGDEEVIMYFQGFADRLEAVGKVSAADCYRVAMGLPGISAETLQNPEVAKHLAMGMIPVMLLLESNKGRTQATYTEAQDAERVARVAPILAGVARSEADFDAWLGATAEPGDHARTCEVHTALYRAIMEQPQAEAADLLRFLTYRRK